MNKKLLLCSSAGQIIAKAGFLFTKPVSELKAICIPTAANIYPVDDRAWFDNELQLFKDQGFNLIHYDLVGKTEADVAAILNDADVIYVIGGNTYYLLEQMQKCNFKKIVIDCLDKGAVYIGSSAGSVIAGPSIDFIGDIDDPTQANLTDYTGLELIDFHIKPHVRALGPDDKWRERLKDHKGAAIIGLKDNEALFVDDHYVRLIV
jgi:dipeptidase E